MQIQNSTNQRYQQRNSLPTFSMSQYSREQQSPRGLRALRYEQLIVPWSSEAPPPAKHHDVLQRVKKIAPKREDKNPEQYSVLNRLYAHGPSSKFSLDC